MMALAVVAAGCGSRTGSGEGVTPPHHVHRITEAASSSEAPNPNPFSVPADTLVATTKGAIGGYQNAGDALPSMTVPGNWYGYTSVLPVIGSLPGWLEVRLAQRPNGSTIWVHQSDVTLSN
ncbi:MAG TPA: hypothetical protein VK773_00235, partial [Acidimicrobiales bacterium]|nr:hypothetical protein [Acidimicrobiales bacterium]